MSFSLGVSFLVFMILQIFSFSLQPWKECEYLFRDGRLILKKNFSVKSVIFWLGVGPIYQIFTVVIRYVVSAQSAWEYGVLVTVLFASMLQIAWLVVAVFLKGRFGTWSLTRVSNVVFFLPTYLYTVFLCSGW